MSAGRPINKHVGGISYLEEAKLRVREKMHREIRRRARALQAIALDKHRNAPRRGENVNRFGERRSAPGDPPAMETGQLFAAIEQELVLEGSPTQRGSDQDAKVVVNYKLLEYGTRTIAPRPLGRQALAEFKSKPR